MELNIDGFGGLKPIVGLQAKVVRIWLLDNNSYQVVLVCKDCETVFINFPENTNIRVFASCKTAHITCSLIAYIDCKVDVDFSTQYIKVY